MILAGPEWKRVNEWRLAGDPSLTFSGSMKCETSTVTKRAHMDVDRYNDLVRPLFTALHDYNRAGSDADVESVVAAARALADGFEQDHGPPLTAEEVDGVTRGLLALMRELND